MLYELSIKNYLFIDLLKANFSDGLTILTGETGSGKSIILEAIQSLASPRLTSEVIKKGEQKCIIEGAFRLSKDFSQEWLADWKRENDIDDDENFESITITREITDKGSKGRVNGILLPAKSIQALGETLLEIHSQSSEQKILSSKMQLGIVDEFLPRPHQEAVGRFKNLFTFWKDLQKKLEEEKNKIADKDRELDFINFQLNEINILAIESPDEEELLKTQLNKLSKVEQFQKALVEVNDLFYESENNVSSGLARITKLINNLAKGDETLTQLASRLTEAEDGLNEILQEFSTYASGEESEVDIDSLNHRLSQIQKMKRKHNVQNLSELLALREKFEARTLFLENLNSNIEKQEKDVLKKKNELKEMAKTLTQSRLAAIKEINLLVNQELQELSLKNAKFEIAHTIEEDINSTGIDKLEFMFMANAGDSLKPLSKVASGGELSRIMLILKAINSSGNTVIFDEIDTGTSGRVSRLIGEKLFKLSLKQQVFCVTHQPLVCALGDHHYHISKLQDQTSTSLVLKELCSETEKIKALLDLMAGEEDMILAQQYATDLLADSLKRKNDIQHNQSKLKVSKELV